MKYITEYIEISPNATEVKLRHVPAYAKESSSYALLQDSFKIFTSDFKQNLPIWGEIISKHDGFYLTFSLDENLVNYTNIVVTYGVTDDIGSSNINYSNLLNSPNAFVDSSSTLPLVDYSNYITSHIEYLASQYKESQRLKSVIGSFLSMAQDVFLAGDTIPYMLDLDKSNGIYLDLIGKIVGVSRRYCGNFMETLNFSIDSYKHSMVNIEEIVLTDICMRKLIKVKIQKNVKEIVNYKELNEIITDFLEVDTFIEPCGEYRIKVDVGNIDRETAKCLILLRAFLPLPQTIELMYIESMEVIAQDNHSSALYPVQVSTQNAYNEPCIYISDKDNALNIEREMQLCTTRSDDD